MAKQKNPITEKDNALTEELKSIREDVMQMAGYTAFGAKEVASFHGVIGGKNNEYVDAVRQQFLSPGQFINEWKAGAVRTAKEKDARDLKWGGRATQSSSAHDIIRWLKNPLMRRYIEKFLERNFYRQHKARVRDKPDDALWELWFGPKDQEYGLLITPRFRNGRWENDVSEIRQANFEYWTIGHVLESGLIVPDREVPHSFSSVGDLLNFYANVLVRLTGSVHAKKFGMRYESFVGSSSQPDRVPFMIPEFRFGGREKYHKHRLDFTVLSVSSRKTVGVELSPWSSHGRIVGKKKLREAGGEKAIEEVRIAKWEAEMKKRNAYFSKFGIATITLTDSDLQDPDEAFREIEPYLQPASEALFSAPEAQEQVDSYIFHDRPES